jgi:hypothetical protein
LLIIYLSDACVVGKFTGYICRNRLEEMENTNAKEEELASRNLIDLVLSWSLGDVLKKDLFKNQVRVYLFLPKFIVNHMYTPSIDGFLK